MAPETEAPLNPTTPTVAATYSGLVRSDLTGLAVPVSQHVDVGLEHLIRSRLRADLDSERAIRRLLASEAGSALLRSAGVDTEELVEVLRQADRVIEVTARSILRLTGRGWAPSSMAPIDEQASALELLDRGSEHAADSVLTQGWRRLLLVLPGRVAGLGHGDDELRAIFGGRADLVERALTHHQAGAHEASVPILLAQAEGIVMDLTGTADHPRGRMLFSRSDNRAEVVDDETIAGLDGALPVVRDWFSAPMEATEYGAHLSRHGVLHGRQLDYATEENSARCAALLAAVIDWARHRAHSQMTMRKQARYATHAGSSAADPAGVRADRRGFVETRDRLRRLAIAERSYRQRKGHVGTLAELRRDPVARYLVRDSELIELTVFGGGWWAWSVAEAGWTFAIGEAPDSEVTYYFEGKDPPGEGPPGSAWDSTEPPNWSGDVFY